MIAVIDYGLGNLGSIKNMLKKIGVDSQITSDINVIDASTKLILPGVGAFDNLAFVAFSACVHRDSAAIKQ